MFINSRPEGPDGPLVWRDAMQLATVEAPAPLELVLHLELPPGHYQGVIRTRRGQFPMDTVHIPLLEWPSLKRVPCGPFDIDHTENQMVAPCFWVTVDLQQRGLAWFDIPSADMVENRYFETRFGFVVEGTGPHTVCLQFRDGETRLTWADVEEIRIAPDERQPVRCPLKPGLNLWCPDGAWDTLRTAPTAFQREILDGLLRTAQTGFCQTYSYRIILLALLHRLGHRQWDADLHTRVMQLVARQYWGFHSAEGELGCDNDRDAGIRLLEVTMALAWAPNVFSADEQAQIRDKIEHHAQIFYAFTVLQKAYWPDTTMEAHGLGAWLGFATAAAFLAHTPAPEPRAAQAKRWLDWCYGNFLRNAGCLAVDGYNPWTVFNPMWGVYLLALFETLTGRRLVPANPAFRHWPGLVADLLAMGFLTPFDAQASAGGGYLREEPLLLGYLGRRNRDRRALALAATGVRALNASGGYPVPLTLLLAGEPPAKTPRPRPVPRALRTRSGCVAAFDRTEGHTLKLEFVCGSPQGPEQVPHLNRYMQFHNSMLFSGNYTLGVDGVPVISGPGGSYDYRSTMFQAVTINGAGHLLEHRYGGYCFKASEQPYIRFYDDRRDLLYAQADLRPAYRADLPLLRALRHVCLLRDRGIVVVVDDFAAAAPVVFAHHLNTPGTLIPAGTGSWCVQRQDARLHLAVLAPPGASVQEAELAYVPTYANGLNGYKSRDWQPEVHAAFAKPPSYRQLTHTQAPGTAFVAAAVYSLTPLQPQWQQPAHGEFTVILQPGLTLEITTRTGTAQFKKSK